MCDVRMYVRTEDPATSRTPLVRSALPCPDSTLLPRRYPHPPPPPPFSTLLNLPILYVLPLLNREIYFPFSPALCLTKHQSTAARDALQ